MCPGARSLQLDELRQLCRAREAQALDHSGREAGQGARQPTQMVTGEQSQPLKSWPHCWHAIMQP